MTPPSTQTRPRTSRLDSYRPTLLNDGHPLGSHLLAGKD